VKLPYEVLVFHKVLAEGEAATGPQVPLPSIVFLLLAGYSWLENCSIFTGADPEVGLRFGRILALRLM